VNGISFEIMIVLDHEKSVTLPDISTVSPDQLIKYSIDVF